MVSIEVLALILTGLSITASILYYTSVLRNQQRTQEHALETRQAQFFYSIFQEEQKQENEARKHLSLIHI